MSRERRGHGSYSMGRANLFAIGTLCKDTQLQQHTVYKRAKSVSSSETLFFKVRNLRDLHHIVSLHPRQKEAHIAVRPFTGIQFLEFALAFALFAPL
jgi:hypothetical protein